MANEDFELLRPCFTQCCADLKALKPAQFRKRMLASRKPVICGRPALLLLPHSRESALENVNVTDADRRCGQQHRKAQSKAAGEVILAVL